MTSSFLYVCGTDRDHLRASGRFRKVCLRGGVTLISQIRQQAQPGAGIAAGSSNSEVVDGGASLGFLTQSPVSSL